MVSPGASISVAVVSNSAGWPASFSLRVVLRERHLQRAGLARADADQLFLEARNELAGADHDRDALAGAAVEGLTVDACP